MTHHQPDFKPRTSRTRQMLAWLLAWLLSAAGVSAAQEPPETNTDWFLKAGAGVFVHYLNGLQNDKGQLHSLGKETSWDQCVREFDTEKFAATMKEVGAGYVIFTIMQVTRHMIAPNATYDRITGYKPGEACATRDLVLDLHESLSKRGIPLMLYFTGDGPRADPQAGAAFGFTNPVTAEFVGKWASVVEEYGLRYGDKVAGYWIDGIYPFVGYNDVTLGIMAKALKADNPKRIIALNRGVDPRVLPYTRHADFTAGEQNRFFDMPSQRWIDGEQWHILSYLSSATNYGPGAWAQPGCAYTKAELGDYLAEVHRRGGVVSMDAMLYRDGSLDRSQIELMKAAISAMRSEQARPPVPPGNLAFGKQAKLLSLDGARELVASGGISFARCGVDGNPDTAAQGAYEWPWTYEVDLVDTVPLKRVKVTFGGQYSTHLEIRVSVDGQTWKAVAEKEGHDGTPFEATFAPTPTRYLRVLSIKPDGPDQLGGQMSVAELEVYK
ncbi:MAG: discoidin domain-containing protein [Thermoguttaceae bacterium]|nr:discoidin domain-containing protein [Thermoguttaceae bacterium]